MKQKKRNLGESGDKIKVAIDIAKMPKLRRDILEHQLQIAKHRLDWLVYLDPPHEKIANFGCNSGNETFQLMWVFDPKDAVGLDVEEDNIAFANELRKEILDALIESENALPLAITSNEDRNWWQMLVPLCAKQGKLPNFVVGDMTKKTGLPNSYFDLAYCSNVLYLIDSLSRVAAVSEMKRVVKLGGWVVASEPTTVSQEDSTPLDFSSIFQQVGLAPITHKSKGHGLAEGYYLFKKTE